ncbi:MAG TPA: cytochrome c-type biogenesis protein [Pyrinomonadaceae bacterium]|nr:cytochrome c-type biogenesis protein [Pyrinomonadaceae bacterium]HLE61683.1 cytochrome c-type biogenesis protein [Pyrinomonadaceae bacterium]
MKQVVAQLMLLYLLGVGIFAQEAKPLTDDPVLEKRLLKLSQELRCLVCQNETLADSQADLAQDLRAQIREQMKAGKTDKEIVTYLTDRYGQFVLYRPPVQPSTYLLWFGPFILLLGGLALLFRRLKQRRQLIQESPLSAEQRRRVEQILKDEEKPA